MRKDRLGLIRNPHLAARFPGVPLAQAQMGLFSLPENSNALFLLNLKPHQCPDNRLTST